MTKKNMEAADYYAVLADIQKKNRAAKKAGQSTDLILERVLKLALTDKDLKNTNDSILELESGAGRPGASARRFNPTGPRQAPPGQPEEAARGADREGRHHGQGQAGARAGASCGRCCANGERIKFETTTKEKEFLEEQLQAGGRTAIVKKYKYSVAVNDDQLYWPYEGEYWRDELGTYQYTLTKGCIERKTANKTVSDAATPPPPK